MPFRETQIEVFNESGQEVPVDKRTVRKAVSEIARQEACSFDFIEVIYTSKEIIRKMNREHLDHDFVTDIITFRYDEENPLAIEGSLFCCAPRIAEQAGEYRQEEDLEFLRVLVHGLLHLAGYDDRSDHDKQEMRKREDFYLELIGS